eukprot:TRINITY_DN111_c0_g2_i1.p1 TRINITY_DN111_c0_g2~~TRINITY_DN111_c0_g2_i1.p1  ORF type:complete len:239 (+),score=78.95 TRINITY_DN111_c0_g2_i1:42-758(+)
MPLAAWSAHNGNVKNEIAVMASVAALLSDNEGADLATLHSQVQSQLSASEQAEKNLALENSESKRELVVYKTQMEEATAFISVMQAQLAEKEADLKKLSAELDQSASSEDKEEQLAQATAQLEESKADRNNLSAELDQSKASNDNKEEQLKAYRIRMEEATALVSVMQAQLEDSKADLKKLSAELDQSKASNEEKEKQLAQATAQLEESKADRNNLSAELDRCMHTTKMQMMKLRALS